MTERVQSTQKSRCTQRGAAACIQHKSISVFPCSIERPPRLEVALGAHADVLHIVFKVDGYLFTFKDELPVHLAAVADGLAPAGADGLHLLDGVCQLQQTGRAREALEGKICPQTVADHRDVQIYRDHEQLLGLCMYQ